ncbi:MAG: AzlD domain-containing protein [Lachnospiraceae bacterium]|nr:AzlD domain-containing protein [Lachnospiraceae bacterium]
MNTDIYIYIFIMAAVSYAIRVLPVTLIKKQIKNQFIQSFLYYVPYVTLAVMTFPAIINATQSKISGILAFIAGTIAAWFNFGLFKVAVTCCAVVFISELFIL